MGFVHSCVFLYNRDHPFIPLQQGMVLRWFWNQHQHLFYYCFQRISHHRISFGILYPRRDFDFFESSWKRHWDHRGEHLHGRNIVVDEIPKAEVDSVLEGKDFGYHFIHCGSGMFSWVLGEWGCLDTQRYSCRLHYCGWNQNIKN